MKKLEYIDFDLYPTPIPYSRVLDKIETIKEELDTIELLKNRLMLELQENRELILTSKDRDISNEFVEELLHSANDGLIEAEVIEEKIVKLTFHFKLPHYPKTLKNKINYYDMLLTYYHKKIFNALKEVKSEWPNFQKEKVVVYIKSFYKDNSIRDLDNRFHSFIFNSLRYSTIIHDDSWEFLSYMEEGFTSDNELNYVNVYISRKSDFKNLVDCK